MLFITDFNISIASEYVILANGSLIKVYKYYFKSFLEKLDKYSRSLVLLSRIYFKLNLI